MSAPMESNRLWLIVKLLADVEDSNFKLQQYCHQNQTLFKPWPSTEGKKDQTSASTKNEEKKDEKVTLTTEEQAGLDMMDKLLMKAQKARNVQNKVNEPKAHRHRSSPKSPKTGNQHDTSNISPRSYDSSLGSELDEIQQGFHNVDTSQKHKDIDESQMANEGCTDNKEKRAADKTKSNIRQDSFQKVNKILSKNTSTDSKVRSSLYKTKSEIAQKGSQITSNRNSSGGERGGKKVVPAHMKAPFKTTPMVTMTKRPPSAKSSTATKSGSRTGSSVPRSNSSKLNDPSKEMKKSENLSKEIKKSEVQKMVSAKVDMEQSNIYHYKCDASDDDSDRIHCVETKNKKQETSLSSQQDSNFKEVKEKMEDLKVEDMHMEEKKPFCLLKDGQNLSIPSNLKRLQGQNIKLRQKFNAEKVTRKVDVGKAGQDFLTKLESTFEFKEEIDVGYKVYKMYHSYRKLLNLFSKVQMEKITEESSIYEILQARKYLEFILTQFHQLEQDRLNLDPEILKRFKNLKFHDTSSVTVCPELKKTSQSHWLPSSITTTDYCDITKVCPHLIKYRSYKELYRYTHLTFQIQYIQLQLYSTDVIAMETIPFLQTLDPNSVDFNHVFRCVYSMLSPGSFPVMVRDTIQELESSFDDG
ncbi:hypothetical protein KUTeg_003430 [Tegillarca granosa]|uniref:Uncharacterized protein n=1 Tax=Tegillarca granosa TaxID=220873 RepID=A0ABQ9FM44_TEGGR|nr:hypothetical protein KUTeg_003430 [Tegillarca granosa]